MRLFGWWLYVVGFGQVFWQRGCCHMKAEEEWHVKMTLEHDVCFHSIADFKQSVMTGTLHL